MICQDFDQVFYPILNAVRISQDFDQLSFSHQQLATILFASALVETDFDLTEKHFQSLGHVFAGDEFGYFIAGDAQLLAFDIFCCLFV